MTPRFPRLRTFTAALHRLCPPMEGRAAWFAIAVAIMIATTSGSSRAADAAPAVSTFRDLQVEVVGTGTPYLMIPGLNSAGATWADTCRALQPGVQCHIVQLPGFAGSTPVSTPADGWLEAMRDRLVAYIDDRHLGTPVVVGHSLGGALALMIAAHSPAKVDRVVIVDSLPFLAALRNPMATPADAKAMAAGMRAQFGPTPGRPSDEQLQATARGMTHVPEGVDRIVAWGRTSDPATTAEAMIELWGTDLRPLLPQITRPVLVLGSWAAYQPMGATIDSTRHIFETQYAGLKGVQIRMSTGGYHFLMWDDPQWLVAQVREFAGAH